MYYERIPADPDYLQALGRAFYNFVYLENIAVHMVGRLHWQGYEAINDRDTSGVIAHKLRLLVERANLPSSLRGQLMEFHERFRLIV